MGREGPSEYREKFTTNYDPHTCGDIMAPWVSSTELGRGATPTSSVSILVRKVQVNGLLTALGQQGAREGISALMEETGFSLGLGRAARRRENRRKKKKDELDPWKEERVRAPIWTDEERSASIQRKLEAQGGTVMKKKEPHGETTLPFPGRWGIINLRGSLRRVWILDQESKATRVPPVDCEYRTDNAVLEQDLETRVHDWEKQGVPGLSKQREGFRLATEATKEGTSTRWCLDYRQERETNLTDPSTLPNIETT